MIPIVTIGVCVRNSAATLRAAIESIVSQDFPHELMEIIFVDDGSEDATLAVIKDSVSRIDVHAKVFSAEWRGLSPTRNTVIDNATGKYIIWVDGDMTLPKDHVRKQVEFMERNPKVGIAKARLSMMPMRRIVVALEALPHMVHDMQFGKVKSKFPGTGGSIYRVEAIRQVGGFDDGLKGAGEDQDAAYRVGVAGWLLDQSPAFFCEERSGTWKTLWDRYFWYGRGSYYLYRKNRKIFSIYRMNPIAGFMAGALYVPASYKLIGRMCVFMLPIHFTFKLTAWCLGFLKAYIVRDISSLCKKLH